MLILQALETTVFLSLLIFFHELGHFLAAKIFGVTVEEFGFGYPPRVFGKRFGETIYSINLIPFGGFCSLGKEEFVARSKRRRILIILGGIISNFLLGWILLSFLFIIGNPILKGTAVVVDQVLPDSPAAVAGVVEGDTIRSIAGVAVASPDALVAETNKYLGTEVSLELQSSASGELRQVALIPRSNPPSDQGPMGVVIGLVGVEGLDKSSVLTAPLKGFAESFRILREMTLGILEMFRKLIFELVPPKNLAGPVGIYQMTASVSRLGLRYLLQFGAFLSLNLFLVNLLPIPALDGGQLLFIAVEIVRRRKVSERVEQLVNTAGMVFLILLSILLTIQDVRRIL